MCNIIIFDYYIVFRSYILYRTYLKYRSQFICLIKFHLLLFCFFAFLNEALEVERATMQKVISIAAVKNGKLLLVKKQDVWILPGGKVKEGESDFQCIHRELREELPNLKAYIGRFYTTFKGASSIRKYPISLKIYFAEVSGKIDPASEISDAKWISNPYDYKISEPTQKCVKYLYKRGHLK